MIPTSFATVGEGGGISNAASFQGPSAIGEQSTLRPNIEYLSDLLGLRKCDYATSWDIPTTEYASLIIGNPEISCAVWPTGEERKILSFSSIVAIDHRSIPATIYAPMSIKKKHHKAIILYAVGGPGGNIAPGLNDNLANVLSERSAIVIKIAYSGTRHNTQFPHADAELAITQISSYAKYLKKLNPNQDIYLVGESLGGRLAAEAAVKISDKTLAGLILVHPLVYSPNEAITNFEKNLNVNVGNDQSIFVKTNGPRNHNDEPIPTLRLFKSFFEKDKQNIDILNYLARIRNTKVVLFYSDTDNRTGWEHLVRYERKLNNIDLINLGPIAHSIDLNTAEQIAKKFEI